MVAKKAATRKAAAKGTKATVKKATSTRAASKGTKAAAKRSASKGPASKVTKAATKKSTSKRATSRVTRVAAKQAATKKTAAKTTAARTKQPAKAATASRKPATPADARTPRLLAGGNPQIAKGYGDAPVQAFLAAIPDWKRDVARRVDALVTRTVPGVQKAVKWNSPLYGLGDNHWFLSFHCHAKYLKVAFFRGSSLDPPPPEPSSMAGNRYLHLREGQPFDESQLASWIRQAAALPGMKM